jgi:hypothetical protein
MPAAEVIAAGILFCALLYIEFETTLRRARLRFRLLGQQPIVLAISPA